jgi:PAS domain S-box-containing protein
MTVTLNPLSVQDRSPGWVAPRNWAIDQAILAAIVESSDDAIIGKTLDGVITTWNAAAERIFEYSADEAIGQSIRILLPPDRYGEESDILDKLRRGERVDHVETVRRTKGGRILHVSLTSSPLRNAAGKIVGASKILRDITGRKETEETLRRQQQVMEHLSRLNTANEMAVSLAHELNQPLEVILNYAGGSLDMVTGKTPPIDKIASALTEVVKEINRIGEIIRRQRRFIRNGDPKRELVNVNALVSDAVCMIESDFKHAGITVQLDLAKRLPTVLVDSVQLMQVFVNLLRNARDAMVDPAAAAREMRIISSLANERLQIDFVDRGCGVAPDRLHQLFDPFVTTKPAGLGMGLAISKTIVQSFQGSLSATINPIGGGMTFGVSLPIYT